MLDTTCNSGSQRYNLAPYAGRLVVIRPSIIVPSVSAADLVFGVGDVYIERALPMKKNTTSTPGLKPRGVSLSEIYPNPFNPTTTIGYQLVQPGIVTLTIFNILGQEVTQLVRAERDAGDYATTWNAVNVPSGIYFVRMTVTDQYGKQQYQESKKLLLLK